MSHIVGELKSCFHWHDAAWFAVRVSANIDGANKRRGRSAREYDDLVLRQGSNW